MARVLIRYWAAARDAAGTAEETYDVASLADLRAAATAAHPRLEPVLARCSFLVDGVRSGPDAALGEGATVEALPPFAGG